MQLRAGAKSRLQSRPVLGRPQGTCADGDSAHASGGGASALTSLTGASGELGGTVGATPGSPTSNLRREVEVMQSLQHPNLVRLYEVIEDGEGGQVLMVMEYCEAGALVGPGALTPDRHLPEAMAQYYFRQMVAGLAFLHANHVVRGSSTGGLVSMRSAAAVPAGVSRGGSSHAPATHTLPALRRCMAT
jgi:hypothetical protein